MKNSLRSGHGKNSYGKTSIYTWFKFSCNQPFLPHLEFLFEYRYDATFHVTTPLQPKLIKRLERKFLKSFFAAVRIKVHGRRRKTALSSMGGRDQKLSHALTCLSSFSFPRDIIDRRKRFRNSQTKLK